MNTYLSARQVRVAILCSSIVISVAIFSVLVYAASRERAYDQWLPTAPLPEARMWPRAVLSNNKLYVIGGKPSPLSDSLIISADLSSSPPLTQWHPVKMTGTTPVSLTLHAVAQTNEHLYIIGGWDRERRYSTVWGYKFNTFPHGYPEPVTATPPDYPLKIVLHDALAVSIPENTNNHVYVFGGVNENNIPQNAVYRASVVDGEGTLGNWEMAAWLPFPLFRMSVVYDDVSRYLYVTGGFDGQNIRPEIHRAKVNTNGTLAAWERENNRHMPKPLYYHDTLIHNNRLYVFGGQDDENKYRKVYSAEINSNDGSLGDWEGEAEIPTSLSKHVVVNDNGKFYIIGGEHDEIAQSQLYYSAENTPEPLPPTQSGDADEDDDNDDGAQGIVGGATPLSRERQLEVTPAPTPSPGIALITLSANHNDALTIGDELTYQVDFQNGGHPLSGVTFRSIIPQDVVLLPAYFQLTPDIELQFSGVDASAMITWTVNGELAPYQRGYFSFRVKRTLSELEHIIHSGIHATWVYEEQQGERYSHPTFNPADEIYLPVNVISN